MPVKGHDAPIKDDDAFVTRGELRAFLVEFSNAIISHFDRRFQEIDRRFDELSGQIAELKNEMAEVKSEVAKVKSEIAELKKRLDKVEERLEKVEDRLKHVEAGQERLAVMLYNAETRDTVRTALIEKLFEEQKKLNGGLVLVQSEMAEFKSQYSMERVQKELEEMRRTTRRLEERVAWLEKNRAGASA